MNILGLSAILLMGFTLGLLGGGGSILSVPVLVYVFKLPAITATSYSLFIVGFSALIGAIRNLQKNNVDINSALTLAIPGILGVSISRQLIIPSLPTELYSFETFTITKNNFILICFSAMMLLASYSMIFERKDEPNIKREVSTPFKVILGLLIGVVTGFVGAGGGFIIVPVLSNILALPIKRAIGTSLLVISINSILGFLSGSIGSIAGINFIFLFTLSAIGSLGLFIGMYFNKFVPAKTLKKGFGVFVLILGTWIIIKQSNLGL